MTIGSFFDDALGAVFILAAFGWCGFDIAQHGGRVGGITAIGGLVLASAGGWLISKTKTLALLDFIFTQAKRAVGIKLPIPTDGSDSDA